MESLHITLRALSAFGGPIKGDTLFGQLCWAARNRWGEERLGQLLDGYTNGRPFAVCSDAFPAAHLPRPALPLHRFDALPDTDRKAIKRRRWLPHDALKKPVATWLAHCRTEKEVLVALGADAKSPSVLTETHAQPHNSINRLTGTTGGVDFAPYTLSQHWFGEAVRLDCYLLVDTACLTMDEITGLLSDIGLSGYGRDATIGLGKFVIENVNQGVLPHQPNADACFTLAPCAPQGLSFNPDDSHYEVFTRFGRHGDRAVHTGRPFKAPVLLAQTGAVLSPKAMPEQPFVGQGLGGDGSLSNAIPETVQQGYTPYVGIRVGEGSA